MLLLDNLIVTRLARLYPPPFTPIAIVHPKRTITTTLGSSGALKPIAWYLL